MDNDNYKAEYKLVGYICPICRQSVGITREYYNHIYKEKINITTNKSSTNIGSCKSDNSNINCTIKYKIDHDDVSIITICQNCQEPVELIEIDKGLENIIVLMNSIYGIRTCYCCSGHGVEKMYISFYSNWDDYLYNKFLDIINNNEIDQEFIVFRNRESDQEIYKITIRSVSAMWNREKLYDIMINVKEYINTINWKHRHIDLLYSVDYDIIDDNGKIPETALPI